MDKVRLPPRSVSHGRASRLDTKSEYSDTTLLSQPTTLADSFIKERRTTNGHVA